MTSVSESGRWGVTAWARKKTAASAVILAGAAAIASMAHAEDAPKPPEVDAVDVIGSTDNATGLSVLPTTVQDTPQAITVIDAAQLKAQGVTSLEQALRNVPGITIAIGEGGQLNGDQFKIRGFDAKDDIYVDGLRDFGAYSRDSFAYEEVQVLKGPSGAMFGRGTTGGAINTVSKTPKLRNFTSLDAYAGNGSYGRALVDFNRQLSETSALRLNLMWGDTKVVDRDLIYNRRWGAAAGLGFGLGTDTQVTFNFVHQSYQGRPDYGIIIVQKPGDVIALPAPEYDVGVERSTFTGYANDLDRGKADILTARFSHKFNDKITFTSDSRYGVYSRYFQYTTLDQCNAACTAALFDGNPATEPAGGVGGSSPYDTNAWGLQNVSTFRLDYNLGALRNQAILGIDASRQINDKLFYAYTLPTGYATRPAVPKYFVNPNTAFPTGYTLFLGTPGQNLTCPSSGNCTTTLAGSTVTTNVAGTGTYRSHADATDMGLLLTDRLWLTDAFSVIGSLRLDRYSAKFDQTLYSGAPSPVGGLKVQSNLTSPRVSAVFEPSKTQTYYLSWGRSQTPQGTSIANIGSAALTLTAKDLDPETSEILEAGAKVMVPGTRVTVNASVFSVKKGNALQTDPSTGFLLAQSGEKQAVKGIELGFNGRISDGWTVSGGYTYLNSRTTESFTNCVAAPSPATGTPTGVVCPVGTPTGTPLLNTYIVGKPVIFVPKQSASLYTNYDMSSVIEGLSIGGDIIYQSDMTTRYTTRSTSYTDRSTLTPTIVARVPSNVTVDLFATYKAGPYRIGFNVYNLTNRLNYTQVFGNRAVPAAGRTFIVSLGTTF